MKLLVLSPEMELLSAEVDAVELPGKKGRFEVLVNHAPLVTSLVGGEVKWKTDGDEVFQSMEIDGGFAEVKENIVTVCVE
ncbi:MAG: F0F1 ATP synthase subunit epsilon [Bacteroidaceae bacterium]|nr:F0F1 ATP synthase subunit epsilon [Bacteroidaceae bacterium]